MAAEELSDEILVVAAIMGDLSAFDTLVARYRLAAMRVAESIVGTENAEDVAQDALLLAFQALPSIEEPTRFGSWLMRITRNRALRALRKKEVTGLGNDVCDRILLQHLPALTEPLVVHEREQEVREALARLPTEFALPLRLHYFDEQPLKRIASFLGVPESTVKWRLFKGRRLLRECLQDS